MNAPKPIVSIGDVVKERYEVMKQLGQGGFGAVYQAKDKKTNEIHAIKVELELPRVDEPGLELEIGVIKRMQNCSHVVRFVDSGKIDKFCFVLMQLAGCNLTELRKACPQQKLTEGTTIRLSLQCLESIEAMHSAGLLHRDIKPANFAMGRTIKDYRNVYILDFGLVRRFRLKNGQVRPARQKCGFRGTIKYASVNVHDGVDLGRVDDLWSWMYMLVEFQKGELPWRAEVDKAKVRQIKGSCKGEMMKDLEKEVEKVFKNLQILKYADEPPYHCYRQQLNQIMQNKKYTSADPFDWEENGTYHEQLKRVCPQPYESQMQSKSKVLAEKTVGEESSTDASDG